MKTLLFFGDVYLKDNHYQFDCKDDYIFNLEYVIDGENYKPITNKINLRGTKDFSGFIRKPVAVNLANNHIMDFTEVGFENTIRVLTDENIAFFGAGTKINNYNNPYVLEKDGKKIALLGYSDIIPMLCKERTEYQVAYADKEQIHKDIELCREKQVDYIIVNVHWGREERPLNTKRQRELGHYFIDEGVDIVIGHHPHCIQPYEVYKDKYIFYSLGNFMFSDISEPSYYNSLGKAEFVMHKKHLRYGKESLSVEFDVEKGTCKNITLVKFDGHTVKKLKNLFGKRSVPILYTNRVINEIIGGFRMIFLLLRSNFFVDNKFVNEKAFKKEIDFLFERIKK